MYKYVILKRFKYLLNCTSNDKTGKRNFVNQFLSAAPFSHYPAHINLLAVLHVGLLSE